jgi:hypothetical protein
MVTKKTALNITQKRMWLGAAFALGSCVVICSAPIFLWIVGGGVVTSLFCTPKEALTVAALCGLAAAGLLALRRLPNTSDGGCEDKAIQPGRGNTPIACDLTVFSNTERIKHLALAKSLLGKARQVIEHEDGLLSFSSSLRFWRCKLRIGSARKRDVARFSPSTSRDQKRRRR